MTKFVEQSIWYSMQSSNIYCIQNLALKATTLPDRARQCRREFAVWTRQRAPWYGTIDQNEENEENKLQILEHFPPPLFLESAHVRVCWDPLQHWFLHCRGHSHFDTCRHINHKYRSPERILVFSSEAFKVSSSVSKKVKISLSFESMCTRKWPACTQRGGGVQQQQQQKQQQQQRKEQQVVFDQLLFYFFWFADYFDGGQYITLQVNRVLKFDSIESPWKSPMSHKLLNF